MVVNRMAEPQRLPIGVDEQGRLPLPWLAQAMAGAQALDRAHALLLCGPAGAGHLELGLLLAQRWLCEGPGPSGASGVALQPCGHCASCHLVRTRVHPDLLVVVPDALRVALGWADEDGTASKSEAKPSRDVRVEQVRQAIAWSQQTSGRGRGKFLLLHPADALNGPAANALLKTLEEPPGQLHLVLTTVDPDLLLPTVRSRCQRLPLGLPDAAEATAWLSARGIIEPAALLALAGGSPMEALDLATEGIDAGWIAAAPGRIAAGDALPLRGRPIPRVVDLLTKLAHDAMAVSVGGQPRYFPGTALPPVQDVGAWVSWQRMLVRTARHEDHPWNAPLLIESLVTQAATAWPGMQPTRATRGGASLHSAR
jgi:DNA polymerase-3 subunit delta'